jgi:hypothetical protein
MVELTVSHLPAINCQRNWNPVLESHAASRPAVFGLSSFPELLQEKRFSTFPKPAQPYSEELI